MPSFPLPVRVATGLAATALEETRRLPKQLIGLPITVTSQLLQLSMRLQQQVTELAIKGDETLAGLTRPESKPEWATFDEDEPAPAEPGFGAESEPAESAVMPDYDQLTLPQLRGRLRRLSESELVRLLDHERSHGQRPEFVRMLSNRIETVRSR